jgi:imidazoleglycerol phosphate synthase glutamine amidotransferase subunit HisH
MEKIRIREGKKSASGMGKNPHPGWEKIRIRDGKKSASGMEKNPHPGWEKIRIRDGKKFASGIWLNTSNIIFPRAINSFLVKKHLNSLMGSGGIRIPGIFLTLNPA